MSIFVGGLPQSAMDILSEYLVRFFPDESVDDLSGKVGLKGMIRNCGCRPEVKLIVISRDMWEQCASVASRTLSMPKAHKYLSDDGLKEFLISNFGDLSKPEEKPVFDEMPTGSVINSEDIPDSEDLILGVSEAEISEYQQEIDKLNAQLSSKGITIKNLQAQIEALQSESGDDIFLEKIRNLEGELSDKEEMLVGLNNEIFELKAKAVKFDRVSQELDESKQKVKDTKAQLEEIEAELAEVNDKLNTANSQISTLTLESEEYARLKEKYATLETERDKLNTSLEELTKQNEDLTAQVAQLTTTSDELRQSVANKDVIAKRLADLEAKYQTAQDEIKQLNEELEELQSIKKQLADVTIELEDAVTAKENAEKAVSDAEAKIQETADSLSSNQEQSKGYLATISNQKEEIARLNSSVDALNKTVSKNNEDLSNTQRKLTTSEEEVSRLRATNGDLSAELAELKSKLTDSGGKADELATTVSALESKVNSLRTQIDEKRSENQILSSAKAKLETNVSNLTDNVASLTKEKDDLSSQVNERQAQVQQLTAEVAERDKKISDLNDSIVTLKAQLSDGADDTKAVQAKLDACLAELEELKAELAITKEKLNTVSSDSDSKSQTLKESLEQANLEVASCKDRYNKLLKMYESTCSELNKVKNNVEALTESKKNLSQELGVLREKEAKFLSEKKELQAQSQGSTDRVTALEDRISELETEISAMSSDNANLATANNKLATLADTSELRCEELEHQIRVSVRELASCKAELQSALDMSKNKDDSITALTKEIAEVRDNVVALENQLLQKSNEVVRLSADVDVYKGRFESVNSTAGADNAEKERQRIALESAEKRLKVQIGLVESKEKEISALNSRLKKLQAELDILKESQAKGKSDAVRLAELTSTVEMLEKNLADYESKLAEANQEIILKDEELHRVTADDTSLGEITQLKAKVTELSLEKKQLSAENTKLAESYKTKLALSQEDVAKLRSQLTSAELQLKAQKDEVRGLKSSIFMEMAGVSLPKSVMKLALPMPTKPYKNVYVFACGSAESSSAMYKLFQRQVAKRSTIRHLIVDLVTDTFIDRDLGVRALRTPLEWLQGIQPVDGFLAETRYANTKVMSTALGYMNDLFLLNVDWGSKLEELSTLADIVLINVGCLDNMVHNILFNSFTSVMRGIVVVKATPINLRTALLRLTGFSSLANTLVACTDYSENTSADVYRRLAGKFQTKILGDNEILSL